MNCIERASNPISPLACPTRPGPEDEEFDLEQEYLTSSTSLDDLMHNMQSRLEQLAVLEEKQAKNNAIKQPSKTTTTAEKKKTSKKSSSKEKSSSDKKKKTSPERPKPAQSKTRRGGTKRERRASFIAEVNDAANATTATPMPVMMVRSPPPPPLVQAPPPRAKPPRRGSMASVCSMDSIDSFDPNPPPRKRKIDLRPHRSVDLYNAQRKDEGLRKALRESPKDYTVRSVHGRKLVFLKQGTRLYIPVTLEQTTRDYYFKKYSYNPMAHMREACWWPTMERQQRRHYQWCVKLTDPNDHDSSPRLIYDSDEDDTLVLKK